MPKVLWNKLPISRERAEFFTCSQAYMEAANRSRNFSFVLVAIIPNYTQSAWNNKSIFSERIE